MQAVTFYLTPSLLTELCFQVLLTCTGSQVLAISFVSYRKALLLGRSNQYKTVQKLHQSHCVLCRGHSLDALIFNVTRGLST